MMQPTRRIDMKSPCSLCSLCCALALTGCAVGPNYSKPDVEVPAQYKEAGDWVVAQPEDASAADLEAARLSLQAELATNYFQLRVTDALIDLMADTVAAFQRSYDMTQNRYRAGVAARVDVVQAETQLLSAQAQAIDLKSTRAQLEHGIAVLIGRAPAAFVLEPTKFQVRIPEVPPGLPSTLLER